MLKQPLEQFKLWYQEALEKQSLLPEAMTLATIDAAGYPDARVVLLKELIPEGFVFFTNYESTKAKQLRLCSQATLMFWWPNLERQVRIRGAVSQISKEQSDTYFKTRPRGSQIGAWSSPQSQVLSDRKELEEACEQFERKYAGQEVPRPEYWGGYCLEPIYFEFWQGGENRLHDRWAYDLDAQNHWKIKRLAP